MKLEILILTLPDRREFLSQLLSVLEPQIASLPLRKFGDVDVRIETEHRELAVGDRRELLRKKSTGDYIAWVDDDDLISPRYISKILPLLDGVDQIGFEVKYFHNGREQNPTFHSLRYGDWFHDEIGFYRDISHICPMRRELAMEVPMSGDVGEDRRWSDAMRGKVRTEYYISEPMYYYLHRGTRNDLTDARNPERFSFLESLRNQR